MKVIGIHQPGYLPWLGFFKKMLNSDIFVYFDDVSFVKNNYYNRNLIRTNSGPLQLTIPVRMETESKINDVKIDTSQNWQIKHKKSILLNYSKTKYFKNYSNFIEELYGEKMEKIIDINIEIIEFLKKEFNIKAKTIFSSELNVTGTASERILEICKLLDGEKYITGTAWAKKFLNVEGFKKNDISVEFQEFVHPEYKQPGNNFISNMTAFDLLFNEGSINSSKILKDAVTKNTIA